MIVYLSYENGDKLHALRLRQMLALLIEQRRIQVWSYQDGLLGIGWREEMAKHLGQAQLFLPLLSAGFFASARCREELELAQRLERAGLLTIVGIYVRACPWQHALSRNTIILPDGRKPIAEARNRDKAWLGIQASIARFL